MATAAISVALPGMDGDFAKRYDCSVEAAHACSIWWVIWPAMGVGAVLSLPLFDVLRLHVSSSVADPASCAHVRSAAHGLFLSARYTLLGAFTPPSPCRLSTLSRELSYIQHALFELGAHFATPPTSDAAAKSTTQFPSAPAATAALESWMDAHTADLPPLTSFILPGGTPVAAALHLARTVARRAEREATNLVRAGAIRTDAYIFLNRLSDYLFTAARAANAAVGVVDCTWNKAASPDAVAVARAEAGAGGGTGAASGADGAPAAAADAGRAKSGAAPVGDDGAGADAGATGAKKGDTSAGAVPSATT